MILHPIRTPRGIAWRGVAAAAIAIFGLGSAALACVVGLTPPEAGTLAPIVSAVFATALGVLVGSVSGLGILLVASARALFHVGPRDIGPRDIGPLDRRTPSARVESQAVQALAGLEPRRLATSPTRPNLEEASMKRSIRAVVAVAALALLNVAGCTAYDRAAGTNTSGVYPQQRDGTPANPSGTAATRALDRAAGTDVSGAYPSQRNGTPSNPPGTVATRAYDRVTGSDVSGAYPQNQRPRAY